MALHQCRQGLRAVNARKVEHEEQRSRVVGALHEAQVFRIAQIFGKALGQPYREALLQSRRLHVFSGIAERERFFQLDGTMQREVGQARCLRGNRANQLHALVGDNVIGLA